MKHVLQSFQSHVGKRGVHFYDEGNCNFLSWKEVFHFINSLPENREGDLFIERLTDTLANYNPDHEFLAVHQNGNSVSVELYSTPSG